jgi:hypothetical protein
MQENEEIKRSKSAPRQEENNFIIEQSPTLKFL